MKLYRFCLKFSATLLSLLLPFAALAQNNPASDSDVRTEFVLSPGLTYHYSHNPEHRPVKVLGIERNNVKTGDVQGLVLFSNSFGQPSAYLFPWGKQYDLSSTASGMYWKWTAGLLYGYKPPYENKVPLNYKGFSPGFIVGVGYQVNKHSSIQLNALGTAALMLSVNIY